MESIHSSQDLGTWKMIRADLEHKRRGWRNKHLHAEIQRKTTQTDGVTREEEEHEVDKHVCVLPKLARLSLKEKLMEMSERWTSIQ